MPNWCFNDCCVYSHKKDEILRFKKSFIESYYNQNPSLYGKCSWGFLYNKTKKEQLEHRDIVKAIKAKYPDDNSFNYYVKGTIPKGDGKKSLVLAVLFRKYNNDTKQLYFVEKEIEYGLFDEYDEIVNSDSSTYNLILNLLNLNDEDKVQGNCRGEIVSFDDENEPIAFVDGKYAFFFQCETAWSEFDGLYWAIDELKKKGEYTDLNFVFVAEECGVGYYYNSDKDHIFFKIEVKADTDISPFDEIDYWDISKESVLKHLKDAAEDSKLPDKYKKRLKNANSLDDFEAIMHEYIEEMDNDVFFQICYY